MNFNLYYISPELILAVGGMLALVAGLATRKWTTPGRIGPLSVEGVSLFVLLAALVPSVMLFRDIAGSGVSQFGGMFAVDGLSIFFKIIGILSSILVIFLSIEYFKKIRFHRGEYYSLIVFATLAITALAASTDMIMIYLSLEFLSITSYILVGYLKQDSRSNEAAVKYFLYGSIAAAVMVYGMSMLYGLTGTTNIFEIAKALQGGGDSSMLLGISTVMVLAGFGFKIAMVPFHQWSPDTYEGAPTPITAFLSVGSKAAGFAVLVRVLATGITNDTLDWLPLIIVLSGITMTVGNLIAIPQLNIKRMLAYSSIAQAGYLLLGVAAIPFFPVNNSPAVTSILLYLFAYLFMNLGAFAVVTIISSKLNSDEIRDYAGLRKRSPFAAWAMVFFLLSLAGIPPTAGFLGKLYLFAAAINAMNQPEHLLAAKGLSVTPLFYLLVAAIVNTVISVYYYLNVVRMMFFTEARETAPIYMGRALSFVIGLTLIMTLIVLIYPQPFIAMAAKSANMFMGM